MPATKSYQTFTWSTGSATATGQTNPINCATAYAIDLVASIVQAGTATNAASFSVFITVDGSTNYQLVGSLTAGTAPGTSFFVVNIPATAQSVLIQYTAQSGGTSSTFAAQLGLVTGI